MEKLVDIIRLVQPSEAIEHLKMAFVYYVACLALIATCHAGPAKNAVTLSRTRSTECKVRNAYYRGDDNCDSYIECIDYVAEAKLCPDGTHFNDKAQWPDYPCGYPSEVPCRSRVAQPAKPTAECPHQYGFFLDPTATPASCDKYRMCFNGISKNMSCPVGLAFNPATDRCDWPDLVPSCNATEFLGFSCPPVPVDEYGHPVDKIINYKYKGDCYYFFSCELGRARLLSCGPGLAFDEVSGRCLDVDIVNCREEYS